MKSFATFIAFSLSTVTASAATVQLDWVSGSLHLADTDITSVSSVYNAWPGTALGLYKEKGFEVMLFGDFGYMPDIPVDGPGFIASNDPGIVQASVAQTISRADGRRFALTSLDTNVGANQVYYNYNYSHPDGTFALDYIESASFKVTVQGEGGTHAIDPFSHSYLTGPNAGEQERRTMTSTGFGGVGMDTSFISISSMGSGQTPCDPRVLSQASAVVQATLPCSDPANFGKINITKTFADGSQVSAFRLNDLGSQNWAWTFNYQPTFAVDTTIIPLPGAAWSLLLAFSGLLGVRAWRRV